MKLTPKEKKLIKESLRLLETTIFCTLSESDSQEKWFHKLELKYGNVVKLRKKI